MNEVLLKMLPVRDPRQLVLLHPIPYPAYELLRDRNGVFSSMLNYSVTRRTNEIGLRMAIGARPQEMLRMVLGEAFWMVACGLAAGIPLAWGAGRLAGSLLYGVTPTDPYALITAILVLAAAALVAAFLPAHRATRVDPLTALRHE